VSRSYTNIRINKEVSEGGKERKEVGEGMDVRTEEIKVTTDKEMNERMDEK